MGKNNCSCSFAFAVLLVTFQLVPCPAKRSTSLAIDESALVALKATITSDPFHMLTTNWTNSSSVCSWVGVTCGLRHHRVTALNISGMSLSGTIPPHLGNLSFIVSLDLKYNFLSGTLPQELSRLNRLKFISLQVNNFTGEIPSWIGLLPKLEYLSLGNNTFTGFIPKSLSNITNLRVLDFSSNSLNGNIPEGLGRLDNLQVMRIGYNRLSGDIPSVIFNISTLQLIFLGSNELSGSLPVDICSNLPFLQVFYLPHNQLTGQIPSNLSRCSQLEALSLSNNYFSGQIPATLGKLTSLQYLYIGGNNLKGVIPEEIGNLQKLVELGMETNQITGVLPLNIFNMSSLQNLWLLQNKLTGELSRDIRNLTRLRILSLAQNNLTGVLPSEVGQLYQLEKIGLSSNSFSGSIPPEMFNISTLQILSLNTNGLSGTLPSNLCYTLPMLERLLLSRNYFSGEIPNSISNCSRLKILDLGSNEFNGFIPQHLGDLRILEVLSVGDNNLRTGSASSEFSFITSLTNCISLNSLVIAENPLDGIIPASIGNLSTSMLRFYASNCKIKGSIPAQMGYLSNLMIVALDGNELTGNIPLTFKHLHNLQGLDLESNNLEGQIPKVLCYLQRLDFLALNQNHFLGSIPDCIGNITTLRELNLSSNFLTSRIPSSLWGIKDLLILDLSSNSLSGSLPTEIGNLVAANYINLSMNQLSGFIPSTLGSLQVLDSLFLDDNKLEGSIPASIGNMISLVSLDLSNNNLSGSIPKLMEKLQHLRNFNVSFNSLSGEIPTDGPFRIFTVDSFIGNDALCETYQRFHGIPPCHIISNHVSRRKKVKVALFVLAGVVALITIVSLAFIALRYKRKEKTTSAVDELVSAVPERISYYEILQATQHFDESILLGIGSFGSVYKGVLRNGKAIAVKVLNMQLEVAFRSFDVECEVLRNIRHRNLTKVISSCSNEDFKAIVFEYMPNGNLEKWLYSYNYCLNVVQRLDIMIDVASALEYLHHGYSTTIVHCDLKPSNVLLDEEMIAHVSDFGLAKLLTDENSTVLTSTLATLGYITPEFGLEGLVSTKCDVYSYGVMLMESFSRKRPSDDMFTGDFTLMNWVENSLQQSPHEVIDTNLLMNLEEEEHIDNTIQWASSIFVLALKCTKESSRDRINMKEALTELHKIKCQFSRFNWANKIQQGSNPSTTWTTED